MRQGVCSVRRAEENLARTFRMEAEAEQNIDWDAVDRSPSGKVDEKRFHVILHYERVAEEESKFEAMVNTQMGNGDGLLSAEAKTIEKALAFID